MKSVLRISLAVIVCVLASTVSAQNPVIAIASSTGVNAPLSVEQVVQALEQRNAQRATSLVGYTSTRTYHLQYKGFPSDREAELTVHLDFTAPYGKRFTVISESGSKFLVNHVLKRLIESEEETANAENQAKVALNTNNYTFTLTGYEPSSNGGQYILHLAPKSEYKFLYSGDIWVSGKDFALTRISAEPSRNPSFWITKTNIEHQYADFSGFWLPVEDRTVSKTRSGVAVLTIQYRDYDITRSRPLPLLARVTAPQ